MAEEFIDYVSKQLIEYSEIERDLYSRFSVKRGLRNEDGSGVLVGLT